MKISTRSKRYRSFFLGGVSKPRPGGSSSVRLVILVSLSIGAAATAPAATDVWNNTGNAWETSGDWTPAGPPTATDIASFDPTVANPLGVISNPTINSATDVALSLNLNNNYLGGTYSFSGTGTLTLGGTGTTGITTRGFGTTTISGPTLAGTTASNLTYSIGTDSGLTLAGATTSSNTGAANLNGGTLTLDNSASTTLHLTGALPVNFGGGTLSILGNAAGTAYSLGLPAFNGGLNTVSLTANGATSVNFANTSASLRTQTFMVEQFVSTTGALGTAAGGQVTFSTTPFAGANGLLASSSGGGTVGFATVRDTTGTNFAVYTTPSGGTGGITAATPTQTTTSGAALQTYAATDRVQYNPAAGAADAATAAVTNGSLRITAAGAGASLALGTNNLASNALMLDGANNFTISGTGTFGATGTRYIYVNNANTSLTTSIVIANSTNPTDIAGPGFVVLNGTTSQNTLGTTNRLTLLGGVLRGNNTQLGFGATGGAGFLNFRGSVLEITNGTSGTGASADFTRPLASTATAGATNWTTSATDEGSGGFSAFGAAASVNIGGASAQLNWASTAGFVTDGYALRFGSTQSNAVLTFQNPIGLDAGTAGTYAAREISVTAGTGGDSTVLSGVISGSASSDLLKTGTGTLNLTATNTYAGRTLVEQGTLLASGTSGAGALNATAGVIIKNTGTLQMGAANQFNTTTPAPVTLNGVSGTNSAGTSNAATFNVNGFSQGSTNASGVGALTLASTSSNDVVDFNSKAAIITFASLATNGATLTINNYLNNHGTSGGPDELIFNQDEANNLGNIVFTGYGAATETQLGGSGFFEVFPGMSAVPEPSTILGGLLLVGAAGWTQRRRLRRVAA